MSRPTGVQVLTEIEQRIGFVTICQWKNRQTFGIGKRISNPAGVYHSWTWVMYSRATRADWDEQLKLVKERRPDCQPYDPTGETREPDVFFKCWRLNTRNHCGL